MVTPPKISLIQELELEDRQMLTDHIHQENSGKLSNDVRLLHDYAPVYNNDAVYETVVTIREWSFQ